ncbi:MAG TPA: PHB depolymerase family esterase [Clostridia bacterium]|nr:PHB depolymerase family esterase [Clostridia bacterium]
MSLLLKQYEILGRKREAYVYIPDKDWDALTKPSSIMVLRPSAGEGSVRELLSSGLSELGETKDILFVFPDPGDNGWATNKSQECDNDIAFLMALNGEITRGIVNGSRGVMNDVHYIAGIGSGAGMAISFTALHPETTAAVALIGGVSLPGTSNKNGAAMPAILFNCSAETISYYKSLNKAYMAIPTNPETTIFTNSVNRCHNVISIKEEGINSLTGAVMNRIWLDLFHTVRRINTCETGNISKRMSIEDICFEKHLNDRSLGDNGNMAHTWLEHVPRRIKDNPSKPVPLVIFSHGAFDNPMKAADMSKWHEIGEKKGFITVYPLAGNGVNFNLNLDESLPDDVGYYLALIRYLKDKYPIDSSRVYLSGFSNGAGMSQVMALLHPELFAAIAPIDSMWPYVKPGPFEPEKFSLEKNLRPITIGLELQRKHNYRMPVWYVYGTREMEYPVCKGLGQQYHYDAWKQYNSIPVLETPDKPLEAECSIGVEGDAVEVLYPCPQYPEYKYSVHKFYSADTHKDYYNFALAHGKAHDVHIVDAELAWQYISRFSRNLDGTLNDSRDSR